MSDRAKMGEGVRAGSMVVVIGNEFGPQRVAEHRECAPVEVFEAKLLCDKDQAAVLIKARLKAAGETLRKIERPRELRGLAGEVASWPAIRHELNDEGNWSTRRVKIRPTAAELSELDEVLVWLLWLDADTRPVVFGQMLGISYRKLSALDPKRRSKSTMAKVFQAGVLRICLGKKGGLKKQLKKL